MNKQQTLKTKDGKSVKLTLSLGNGRITAVKIEGDFYAWPEEKLPAMLKALEGASAHNNEFAIAALLSKKKRETGVEMAGISEYDIAKLAVRALK